MREIVEIISINGYEITVKFDNNVVKKLNLKEIIDNHSEIASKLQDVNEFKKVKLEDGVLTWDNVVITFDDGTTTTFDLDNDVLYEQGTLITH